MPNRRERDAAELRARTVPEQRRAMPSGHLRDAGPGAEHHLAGGDRHARIARFGRVDRHTFDKPGHAVRAPFEGVEAGPARGVEWQVECRGLARLAVSERVEKVRQYLPINLISNRWYN